MSTCAASRVFLTNSQILRGGAEEHGEELYEKTLRTIYRFGNDALEQTIDSFFGPILSLYARQHEAASARSRAVCLKMYDDIVCPDVVFAPGVTKEELARAWEPKETTRWTANFLQDLAHATPPPRSIAASAVWAAARGDAIFDRMRDEDMNDEEDAQSNTEVIKLLREFAKNVLKLPEFLLGLPADYVADRDSDAVVEEACAELRVAFSGGKNGKHEKLTARAYSYYIDNISVPPTKKAKKAQRPRAKK